MPAAQSPTSAPNSSSEDDQKMTTPPESVSDQHPQNPYPRISDADMVPRPSDSDPSTPASDDSSMAPVSNDSDPDRRPDPRDSVSQSIRFSDESSEASLSSSIDDDSTTDQQASRKRPRGPQAPRKKQELQRRAIQNELMKILNEYQRKGKFDFEPNASIPWGVLQRVKREVNKTTYKPGEQFNCSDRQVSLWCAKVRKNGWRQTSCVVDYSRIPSTGKCWMATGL